MIAFRSLLVLSATLILTSARAQLLNQVQLDTMKEFHSIESALKDPDHVYRLDLSKKKLKEVPEDLKKFRNLNALDLGNNKLKTLPDWFKEFVYMQEFRAGKNKF